MAHTGFSPNPTSGDSSTLQVSTSVSGDTPVRRTPAAPATERSVGPALINLVEEDQVTVNSSVAASSIAEIVAEQKLVQKRKALAQAKAELAEQEVREAELEQQESNR